jgi:hypothetical protein
MVVPCSGRTSTAAPIAWNEPSDVPDYFKEPLSREDAEGETAQLEPLLRTELQPTFIR